MNKKKIIIFIIIITIITIFVIFFINKSKTKKIGKNSSSQDIIDYILNISSYETTIEVEVNSNKNSNKYILKQQYIKDKTETQEVIEPSNISGVKIIKENNSVKIENTKLKVSSILEKYNYIADNNLDLSSFINNYKDNNDSNFEEKDNHIIMNTSSNNNNKYAKNKRLYIDKNSGNPVKMEITDINKNVTIYILYKEVKINSLNEDNVLAFNLYDISKEI